MRVSSSVFRISLLVLMAYLPAQAPVLAQSCEGTLYYNHDETFEMAYCPAYNGTKPPYYGALAEGFDVGPGTISCEVFWFTQIGEYDDQPMDVYVWDGGVTREPGEVLCHESGIIDLRIPNWPNSGANEIPAQCEVAGEFTIGFWAESFSDMAYWYVCADEDGPGGNPWVYQAPGLGYPSGWIPYTLIAPTCHSFGIGVYLTRDPASVDEFPGPDPPPESPTWGRIKALFRYP